MLYSERSTFTLSTIFLKSTLIPELGSIVHWKGENTAFVFSELNTYLLPQTLTLLHSYTVPLLCRIYLKVRNSKNNLSKNKIVKIYRCFSNINIKNISLKLSSDFLALIQKSILFGKSCLKTHLRVHLSTESARKAVNT